MNGLSFSKGQFFSYVSAVLISVFFVAMMTFGASTISTNITTDGTLSVTGAASFTGAIYASSTLGVTGVTNFYGNVALSNYATSTASTGQIASQSGLSASGTVAIGGVSTLYGNLAVNGFATTTASNGNIDTEGQIVASSSLAIGGVSNLYGNLVLNGFATGTAATGNIDTEGGLFASGTVAFLAGGNNDRFNAFGTTTIARAASTSVAQEVNVADGDVYVANTGTTSLILDTSTAAKGSCIGMRHATSGAMYRIYIAEGAGGSGPGIGTNLRVEAGNCQ